MARMTVVALELECRQCGWRTVCGRDDALGRLRLLGLLRRDPEVAADVLVPLFLDAAPRMTCPLCKEKRLAARELDADEIAAEDDWQAAVLCEICRQSIAPERLEALPGTKRCVACQGKSETGVAVDDEPEYCPQCGSLVELRVSRGSGITRYKRVCTGIPPCRL
jgi:Zn finger protein HypA/HybF involved in hydrogenase expression